MARYSFTVSYNDPNIGFQIQDAVAKIIAGDSAEEAPAPAPAPTPFQSQPRPAPQQPQNGTEAPRGVQNPDAEATPPQISFINKLVAEREIDDATFWAFVDGKFGREIPEITALKRGEASALIESLKNGEVQPAAAPF